MPTKQDLLVDSSYEMDKIIWSWEGKVTDSTPLHNLGYAPLIFGIYDTDPDFSNPRPINDKITNSVRVYSNTVGISKSYESDSYYVRLFAFKPSTVEDKTSTTAYKASQLQMSSDFNYAKLLKAGHFKNSGSVAHNLGYYPKVMIWAKITSNTGTDYWCYASRYPFRDTYNSRNHPYYLTENELVFQGTNDIEWEYRIYV